MGKGMVTERVDLNVLFQITLNLRSQPKFKITVSANSWLVGKPQ